MLLECKSNSADCGNCTTAGEEDVSETGWNSIHASKFGLEGGEGHCGVGIVYHFEVGRDDLLQEQSPILGVGEGLFSGGGHGKIGLLGSARKGAVV